VVLGWALACSEPEGAGEAPSARDGPLAVYAVNEPLRYFAQRIGGAQVRATLPAPPDVDPAFWDPPAEVVAAYQSADLILENGAGYAAWTARATLPRSARVDTSRSFADRLIVEGAGATHGHGPEGDHTHAPTAFTTWLDPELAALQARATAEAMIAKRPEAEGELRDGLAALEGDLEALDARWQAALAPLAGEPVLFSHPVYQYLARRYGLTGHSLHWEPGELPDASEWRPLEARLEQTPAGVMFFEGEPHPDVEERLEGLGVRVIVFAPGGNETPGRDWLALMQENAERVEAAAEGAPGSP